MNCLNASVCAAEELNTLKGIEGESPEDKPAQQVKPDVFVNSIFFKYVSLKKNHFYLAVDLFIV